MNYCRIMAAGWLIVFGLVSQALAEDYSLHYFIIRVATSQAPLTPKEREALVDRIEKLLEQARGAHRKMIRDLQAGGSNLRYQEGEFWRSKLKEDEASIQAGLGQVQLLKGKPGHLTASIGLYKTLKDLSVNFNAYNNVASFSAFVGDLAPELGLWGDPVFYELYLLPLAHHQEAEKTAPPPKKEIKPVPKGKKP